MPWTQLAPNMLEWGGWSVSEGVSASGAVMGEVFRRDARLHRGAGRGQGRGRGRGRRAHLGAPPARCQPLALAASAAPWPWRRRSPPYRPRALQRRRRAAQSPLGASPASRFPRTAPVARGSAGLALPEAALQAMRGGAYRDGGAGGRPRKQVRCTALLDESSACAWTTTASTAPARAAGPPSPAFAPPSAV